MKILMLSRAYPPITGGIENHNYFLAKYLGKQTSVTLIANKRGKKFLPIFLPAALLRCAWHMRKNDVLLLGDGVLAPLGALVSLLYPRKTFASVIHGLDVTYARKHSALAFLYRIVNIPSMRLLDKLIMVGNQTIEEAVLLGIDRAKCVFVPNGIEPQSLKSSANRSALESYMGISLKNKKIIVRVGRFVKHKGVAWFIRNVLPTLDRETILIAAGAVVGSTTGDSDDFANCEKAIQESGMRQRAILIPNAPRSVVENLLSSADVYVSPNIRIVGSMEGFGINAIEAAASGSVVVASDLDGLKDAIIPGKNGFLVPPEDSEAYTRIISRLLQDTDERIRFGKEALRYTREHFSWETVAARYLEVLKKITHN